MRRATLTRRGALVSALALGACGGGDAAIGVGYQPNGVLLLAQARGRLEEALQPARLSWLKFPAGPPLLEAMNAGSVWFGATGDAPPLFAQAAGVPLLYVAAVPLSGAAGGVLTPAGSKARSVADLRGARLAFTRGSSAHAQAAGLLATAGLTLSDVKPVNLAPADAGPAFARGEIDAWLIWDPYFTNAIELAGARVLIPGGALPPTAQFMLAHRRFVEERPDVLSALLDGLAEEGRWAAANRAEAAGITARETGLDAKLAGAMTERGDFELTALSPEIVARQQAIADLLAETGDLARPIRVADAVWSGWRPA